MLYLRSSCSKLDIKVVIGYSQCTFVCIAVGKTINLLITFMKEQPGFLHLHRHQLLILKYLLGPYHILKSSIRKCRLHPSDYQRPVILVKALTVATWLVHIKSLSSEPSRLKEISIERPMNFKAKISVFCQVHLFW